MHVKKLISLAAISAFYAGSLVGCIQSPTDTTEQTGEISPEAAGIIALSSFNDVDSLSGTLQTAASSFEHLSTPETLPTSTAMSLSKNGLAKISTDAPVSIDLSDTAKGSATVIFHTQTSMYAQSDTIVIKWDDQARDTIDDNENIISASGIKEYALGKTEHYCVSDADGDGVAAGSSEYNIQALFTYTESWENGTITTLTMQVNAGADQNFDEESDNKIETMTWLKTKNDEKAGEAQFIDADGDGYITDNSASEPSTIDVYLFEGTPLFKPFVSSSKLNFRVVSNGNESEDKIIKLYGEETLKTGRVSTFTVTDESGDSIVTAGERARAVFATNSSPAADPVLSSQIEYVFDVHSGLQNDSDNVYYSLEISQQRRIGWVRSRTFSFATTEGLHEGQNPTEGHLEMTVTYATDESISIVVDFSETGFSGTYTGPDGEVLDVEWDSEGEVISSTPAQF